MDIEWPQCPLTHLAVAMYAIFMIKFGWRAAEERNWSVNQGGSTGELGVPLEVKVIPVVLNFSTTNFFITFKMTVGVPSVYCDR